jgi:hypothetical protein
MGPCGGYPNRPRGPGQTSGSGSGRGRKGGRGLGRRIADGLNRLKNGE